MGKKRPRRLIGNKWDRLNPKPKKKVWKRKWTIERQMRGVVRFRKQREKERLKGTVPCQVALQRIDEARAKLDTGRKLAEEAAKQRQENKLDRERKAAEKRAAKQEAKLSLRAEKAEAKRIKKLEEQRLEKRRKSERRFMARIEYFERKDDFLARLSREGRFVAYRDEETKLIAKGWTSAKRTQRDQLLADQFGRYRTPDEAREDFQRSNTAAALGIAAPDKMLDYGREKILPDELATLKTRQCPEREAIKWAHEHYTVDVLPLDAPSLSAWNHLMTARKSVPGRTKLMETILKFEQVENRSAEDDDVMDGKGPTSELLRQILESRNEPREGVHRSDTNGSASASDALPVSGQSGN